MPRRLADPHHEHDEREAARGGHEQRARFASDGSGFPEQRRDLQMSCSCPDSAVPCKHLAAVYYVLAEWLDRDPFLLFELRGRDRDALLTALRERHAPEEEAAAETTPVGPDEPLDVASFWSVEPLEPDPDREAPPAVAQALLRALGDPPGWNEAPLAATLRPVYERVSRRAGEILDGEPETASGRDQK